jgi:hypothetical protein
MNRRFALTCLLASVARAPPANDGGWDSLQMHGFASQALVHTSDNRYFGDSSNTSLRS